MPESPEKFSTSALARQLDIPMQQLFAVLRDYKWIERAGDEWVLTPKGEFEGGSYRTSKRYGRYIVWPSEVASHPLLVAIEAQQRHSAVEWSDREGLPHTAYLERLLIEIGWLRESSLGPVLTGLGRENGGEVAELSPAKPSVIYWPHSAEHNTQLQALIHHVKENLTTDPAPKSDLFELTGSGQTLSIDGRTCSSQLQARCANWLYLRRIHFSINCQIVSGVRADIFLPEFRAIILLQPKTVGAALWKSLLEAEKVFAELGYKVLVLSHEHDADIEYRMDHWLRELLSAI